MDSQTEELNDALKLLVGTKIRLEQLDYNDEEYDHVEEQLHDQEDQLIEQYGKVLEEALHEVHDEYCPDSDILLPIAYLGDKYTLTTEGNIAPVPGQGVIVEADDFDDALCRLVLSPDPVRLILDIGGKEQRVVWKAKS